MKRPMFTSGNEPFPQEMHELMRDYIEAIPASEQQTAASTKAGEVGVILGREIERLSDALRWRKWPEEKPEEGDLCLVRYVGDFGARPVAIAHWNANDGWRDEDGLGLYSVTHWLPIPPMGKE